MFYAHCSQTQSINMWRFFWSRAYEIKISGLVLIRKMFSSIHSWYHIHSSTEQCNKSIVLSLFFYLCVLLTLIISWNAMSLGNFWHLDLWTGVKALIERRYDSSVNGVADSLTFRDDRDKTASLRSQPADLFIQFLYTVLLKELLFVL